MLQSSNRFNPPAPPPLMLAYIHQRVARRAAFLSGQATLQLEISKSAELIRIEERYRTDRIKQGERVKQREFRTWH